MSAPSGLRVVNKDMNGVVREEDVLQRYICLLT